MSLGVQNAATDASYQTYLRRLTQEKAWNAQAAPHAPGTFNPSVGPGDVAPSAQLTMDLRVAACVVPACNPG
jgi:hypothetical protein